MALDASEVMLHMKFSVQRSANYYDPWKCEMFHTSEFYTSDAKVATYIMCSSDALVATYFHTSECDKSVTN